VHPLISLRSPTTNSPSFYLPGTYCWDPIGTGITANGQLVSPKTPKRCCVLIYSPLGGFVGG
jgi:hypothetical protein